MYNRPRKLSNKEIRLINKYNIYHHEDEFANRPGINVDKVWLRAGNVDDML